MAPRSMTAFARADGEQGNVRWHWEVRSVNGRGLDLRLKLPPGLEGLEPRVREAVTKRLSRGNVGITLTVKREEGVSQIRLNEDLLRQVRTIAEQVRAVVGGSGATVDTLLAIKGVLEIVEASESEEEAERRAQAMLKTLQTALGNLTDARASEGERLRTILLDGLVEIERLVKVVSQSPARSPEAIQQRIREQVARITESTSTLDETRLHQEAVMLATRADVEEELQRLGAHLAAARELLDTDEPVGRRLDFLSQEFNRETNTLCSKSNDTEITRQGLQLKALIEQMREQVQNIE